jgi:beta-glucanase (GH16 family)
LSKHDWNYSKGNSFVHKGNVIGGWGNNELQFYRIGRGSNNINSNLFIEDGLLKIQPIHHGSGYRGHSFTSARINTKSKISFTYPSRITFCFKVPSGIGFWPAFWLMPDKDSDWPKGGEIDIMENRGRITNVSSSALHFGYKWNNKATLVGEAIIPSQVNFQDAFHSITLEWYEDSLSFYMDSDPSPYFVVSSDMDIFKKFGYPFNSSFYLIINVAVGGIYDNYLVDKEAFCKNSSCSNKIDPDRSRFLIDWIEYESLKN